MSPNSARRHPSKQKYVPPTLKATGKSTAAICRCVWFMGFCSDRVHVVAVNASLAMSAFGMGLPKKPAAAVMDMALVLKG